MKKFNTYFENNSSSNNNIKETIISELFKRYFATNKSDNTTSAYVFANTNTYSNPFSKLFNSDVVRNPLSYAKTLFHQSKSWKQRNLEEALERLRIYAKFYSNDDTDDYDMTINGIPVKFYEKFVQIGSHIIPLYEIGYLENLLTEPKKKNITNLIINISNNIEINNVYNQVA